MKKGTYLLLLYLFIYPAGTLRAQVDSLDETIDRVQIKQQLERAIYDLYSVRRDERLNNRSNFANIQQILEWSKTLQDTLSLSKGMRLQAEWIGHHDRAYEKADSLMRQARFLHAYAGFTLSNTSFGSSYNSYKYNWINDEILVFTDSLGEKTFEEISDPTFQQHFGLNNRPKNGMDSSHVYWFKLRLKGDGIRKGSHLLLMNTEDEHWQKIEFFYQDRAGKWQSAAGGASVPFDERLTNDWRDFYPIEIEPDGDFLVYFRLSGFKPGIVPQRFSMRQLDASFIHKAKPQMLIRVYAFIAILAFQFFFFLLWYSVTQERTFVPYLVYISGILIIAIISIHLRYWFPNPNWNNDSLLVGLLVFFSWISGLGLIRFVQMYLNSVVLIPRWNKALVVFKYSYSFFALLLAFMLFIYLFPSLRFGNLYYGFVRIIQNIFIAMFILGLSLITLAGTVSWRKGYQPAKYYLVAIVCLLGSLGLMSLIPLTNLGATVSFDEAMSTVQAGIVLQLCFFALGIGNKRRTLEKEKMKAQNQLLAEQQKVNSAFGRFVPHKFLEAIGRDSVLEIKLGDGVEKEVTVFFSDIRGYTRLAEQMQPQENFRFLNGYLGRLGPIISGHNGFVNQYYGDGIMAIFMQHPEDALKAALAIQIRLQAYNEERKQKGRIPIKIGIGMHTGPLIMGVIGDTLRMEAGVVSDTVNTAARMEGLTKHFGASVLVSETVFDRIPENDSYAYRYLGKVQVKGKQEPLRIYDFFGSDIEGIQSKKAQTKGHFDQGLIAYYDRDFAAACHAFNEVLKVFPNDQSSNYFMQKAQDYLVNGVAANWTGVEEMLTK